MDALTYYMRLGQQRDFSRIIYSLQLKSIATKSQDIQTPQSS